MKNKWADRSFWGAIAGGITLLVSIYFPQFAPVSRAVIEPVVIDAGCKATDCDGTQAAEKEAEEQAFLEAVMAKKKTNEAGQ